jgi:hypothetical protein
MTTAQTLIKYRAELIAGGFSPETAEALAMDAGNWLVRGTGLAVESSEAPTGAEPSGQG